MNLSIQPGSKATCSEVLAIMEKVLVSEDEEIFTYRNIEIYGDVFFELPDAPRSTGIIKKLDRLCKEDGHKFIRR